MKTSLTKPATTVVSKSGKPKTKAKAAMGNLFQMEEDDQALLLSDDITFAGNPSASKGETTTNESKTETEKSKKTSSKRTLSSNRSRSKNSSDKNRTLSTESEVNSNSNKQEHQASVNLTAHLAEPVNCSPVVQSEPPQRNNVPTLTTQRSEGNSLGRYSFRELDNSIINDKETHGEYSQEMTNEELDGVSKQMSSELTKDLSFELTDEFIVELSELEFGDILPEEETPKDSSEEVSKNGFKKDGASSDHEPEKELEGKDESFELPDNYAAIDDKDIPVEDDEFNIPLETEPINPATQPTSSQQVKEPSLKYHEDEKFDLDELINAGTNSYSCSDNAKSYSVANQYNVNDDTFAVGSIQTDDNKVVSDKEDMSDTVIENSLTLSEDKVFEVPQESQNHVGHYGWKTFYNESNYLPFGKTETIQLVLQAWAFGDTVALIKLGKEASLEDDPFYTGDDENFGTKRVNTQSKTASQVEVIEHPLARYGLKVRTINAIELVGKKNYYSLSEESRKVLELLVQDLSKTEEGSARNLQLKQSIFGMFE